MRQTTLHAKAEEARSWLRRDKRTDGEAFWRTKEGAPEWVTALVYKVHGDGEWLPDDYRYEYLVTALDLLVENPDADPDELADEIEADVYTNDLLTWLQSNLQRQGYVDEALETFADPAALPKWMEAVGWGQVEEKREVFHAVVQFLQELDEEDTEEE